MQVRRVLPLDSKCASAVGLTLPPVASALNAYAQPIPWKSPLRQLLASLQGPAAQAINFGAIVIAGLALCVSEAASSNAGQLPNTLLPACGDNGFRTYPGPG